jgi:hypothetical protein
MWLGHFATYEMMGVKNNMEVLKVISFVGEEIGLSRGRREVCSLT